jgi:hypothetical protein
VLDLVEIAVAFAITFLAFGKDERPAPPEEHVLGAAPRAVIQGGVTGLLFVIVMSMNWVLVRGTEDAWNGALCLQEGLLFVLPALVETRARQQPTSVKRDLAAAVLVFLAGALTINLGDLGRTYGEMLVLDGSESSGLAAVHGELFNSWHSPGRALAWSLLALVFVAPAIARLRDARPRIALVVSLAGASLAGAVVEIALDAIEFGRVSSLHSIEHALYVRFPYALALSLGGAFSDKLLRRLESRLDPVRLSAPR